MRKNTEQYKKQRRIYLVQTQDRVTRYAFPQLKACLDFVNKMYACKLLGDLKYAHVAHRLSKYELFEYTCGGGSNWIQRLVIEGSFITSERQVKPIEGDFIEFVKTDLLAPIIHAQFRAQHRALYNDWQVFDGNLCVGTVKDRSEAYLWVEDRAAKAQLLVY